MEVYKEMEMYTQFHLLHNKYGTIFLDWYYDNCKTIGGNFDIILEPETEMEKDISESIKMIHNPREFNYEEVVQFEEKVCRFLAQNISCSRIIHNKKDKMILFRDRYIWFRKYYMSKLT